MLCLLYLLSLVLSANSLGVRSLIQFEFISDNYSTQSYKVDNLEIILENPKFDRRKQTAIYSYGFTQSIYQPSVREIVDAYLENGDFNFLLVNYQSILAYNVLNANEFGDNIAGSLIKLFEKGYGDFHLIGFSLGGQISGAVGRYVTSKSSGRYKIPRITGLDPGQLPPFFQGPIQDLNAGDAIFVDTIHGESKLFGSRTSLGNASFWVNGGVSQPSCRAFHFLLTSICSHLTTPKFWAETVRRKSSQQFPAYNCRSYNDFKSNRCDRSSVAFMGLYVDSNASGKFYLDAAVQR